MALSSKLFPPVVVLLLLLAATEMGVVKEAMAAECQQARCQKCIGACGWDEECTISCKREGFDYGECHGANHRCICKKNC